VSTQPFGQADIIGIAIGVLCLLIAYGVLAMLGGAGTRHRRAPYQRISGLSVPVVARAPDLVRRPTATPPIGAVGQPLGVDAGSSTASPERGAAEPHDLVRRWLDESHRMLETTRRERVEMAETLEGFATSLIKLEQAADAVAQGLRAKR
jgi:hypothetical protein